ncbi:APC family permease [Rothia kristinae]|uniref:APC family permease n=1 Tax=Rothia kristinae TaxID=37923 RepID=A0A7T3CFQ9_9MICC|nr:APC family permease [Rothia kristinae]QPT53332.1 APC family permease [Rothia kristinae]SQC37951.1 Low-affinity putrescine importer PlaP [Rothia kristinae]
MTAITEHPERQDLPHTPGLARRHLSTTALVFMIIAASAPLTVLAGGVPTNFAVSGLLGVPLGYLALGVILALFAVGYGAMSSHIQNAGAFYAYIGEGLGPRQGIAAAVLALVSYNMMQIGLYGMFGFALSAFIATMGISLPWWLSALLGWAVVAVLGVRSVDLSAKVLGVLVALEFLVVIVVCVLSLGTAPEGISAQTLEPGQFFAHGIGVLLAFAIAAFMGFESGAIYSEEAKDPRRTVARATYIAVGVIAVFYAFSAWALAMGVGPSMILSRSAEEGPDLVFLWLAQHSEPLSVLANLLFITSLLAALIAFHNAAARYFFALGRSRVLPSRLGASGRSGAPIWGSLAQSSLAIIVIAVFAVVGTGSPLGELFPVITLFTWLTNAAAFGLVFLLAVTSVAVIAWFHRNPEGHGPLARIIAPTLAALGLLTVFGLILANFDLMIGADGPTPLVIVMPTIILSSGVLGWIWAEILRRRRPEDFAGLQDLDHHIQPVDLPTSR